MQRTDITEDILTILQSIPGPAAGTNTEFRDLADEMIRKAGFATQGNALIEIGGKGYRIALVVDGHLAICFDWKTPRLKSKAKLRAWGGPGFVYCRASGETWKKEG